MRLHSVQIENFRAVKHARISLDPTTVLIGENDCGRSSILEAVALALGWNSAPGEFRFQPFHLHRSGSHDTETPPHTISIALEFSETTEGEWNGEDFEILRTALPAVLTAGRRFVLEVTHREDSGTRWTFRSAGATPLPNDRELLAWLRGRMPVFRMRDGILARRQLDLSPGQWEDRDTSDLVHEVTLHYQNLLEGTAPDVQAAIAGGSAAARQLLVSRASLRDEPTSPFAEIWEEITGKRKAPSSGAAADLSKSYGSAAYRLGLLLLVGALLRSGAGQAGQGADHLTLLEDPETHLHPMTLAAIWSVIGRIGGQKIIATHSGALLASARLSSMRRLTRRDGVVREWRVPEGSLSADELRRYSYHLRSRRAAASFARCWLLVEGETEYWLMDELARVCGYDFSSEGVTCVEFAQCGLPAVIKVARHLGIQWHLLADGDAAGQRYARSARECAGGGDLRRHITVLQEPDVEHAFWRHGYQHVFLRAAFPATSSIDPEARRRAPAKSVINRALNRYSKPYVAVLLLDAVSDRGAQGVPPRLRAAIETCIQLARTR